MTTPPKTRIQEIRERLGQDQALEIKYRHKLTSTSDLAYLLAELEEAVKLLSEVGDWTDRRGILDRIETFVHGHREESL